jgi:hypothetical protein
MKLGYFVATALLSSTIISTPAFADTVTPPTADAADGTTLAAMQSQCDALAAVHGPATGDNDHFTGEVVEGDVTLVSGPTETGNRVIDEESITPIGTYVPAALEIRGNPYKSGGSVNMFGDQWSTAGYYPDSTYNFTADFDSTFAHAFSCNNMQEVYHAAVHHDAVFHPAVPPDGFYTNNGTNPSGQEGSCQGLSPANPHWGTNIGNCIWTQTAPGEDAYTDPAYDDPAYWDDATVIGNEAGTAVNQDQSDNLAGFEDHGGRVDVTGEYFVGKAVICISPGSKGGSWRAQNGYNGGSWTGPAAGCNTPYFKIAPTNSGTTTSQGTFISVPNYNLP